MDNRLENLRVICPNCHSQTKTYRGKNLIKSEREEFRKKAYVDRNKVISNKKKKERIIKPKNRCAHVLCENTVTKNSNKFCSRECYNKVNQKGIPTAGELISKFIQYKSYLQVGKYYNVTDNAVRKWCKKYDIVDIVK